MTEQNLRATFLYQGVIRPVDPTHANMLELGLTLYRGPAPEPVLRLDDVGKGAAWRHTQAWISAGRPEKAFQAQTFDPRSRPR